MLVRHQRLPVLRMLTEGLLPSFLKTYLYRLRGAHIGKDVRIGPLSVVMADTVSIGDQARVGFGTVIRGRSVKLGDRTSIGSMTAIEAEELEIREDSRINEQVYVAGPTLPESALIIGKRCLIQQHVFINPTKRVTIGDDSVIGARSSIVTHATWPNVLEGAAYKFAEVTIGSGAYVAWQVMVLPGVRIGDSATVGAGSVVNREVDPNSVVAGVPARPIAGRSTYPERVSADNRDRILTEILSEFSRYLEHFGYFVEATGTQEASQIVLRRNTESPWNILILHEQLGAGDLPERVACVFPSGATAADRDRLDQSKTPWFDLAAKERGRSQNDASEELADFFTRYGIRFARS